MEGPRNKPARDLSSLHFATIGSVDDGKSTLIGRLLMDTDSIPDDQMEAIQLASERRGEATNLALLTDGLRAEREQNITIDVAYRYFSTPKRNFIIADTPGHVQYTRNMVTGASKVELAVILLDARKGVLQQSKRHAFIASLLGIPQVVVAVNKMDLVDWSQDVFEEIRTRFLDFSAKLEFADLTFVPVSAVRGDNVVVPSTNMPWYTGTTLLSRLEGTNRAGSRNLIDFRFPVQYVVRPDQDYRGYAGQVASGTVRPGEEVVILPAGHRTTVRSVDTFGGSVDEAAESDAVVITVADDLDISRGDMIVRPMNLPYVDRELDVTICWMSEQPMRPGSSYILMHTTRMVQAVVRRLVHRIDVNDLHRDEASELGLNDIGRVHIETADPLFFDPYRRNRETGSFILIDPHSKETVGAGMVRDRVRSADRVIREARGAQGDPAVSPDVVWERQGISREIREDHAGHRSAVVWLTGLPASGKSTIARLLEKRLYEIGCRTVHLDGDRLRHGLCGDLGFSDADRRENIRRVSEVASLFVDAAHLVICSFVSPSGIMREHARSRVPAGRFIEIHVDTSLEECMRRDPKGLYAKALRGEISGMTGVDAPYEAPENPELRVDTSEVSAEEAADMIVELLRKRELILGR